jgi:hypothetical protein
MHGSVKCGPTRIARVSRRVGMSGGPVEGKGGRLCDFWELPGASCGVRWILPIALSIRRSQFFYQATEAANAHDTIIRSIIPFTKPPGHPPVPNRPV